MVSEDKIREAADIIRSSQRLVALTGAGVSKESGVPTFRDAMEGLWARFDPSQLATPYAFQQNPKLVWDWYEYRRGLIAEAKPNPGHVALAALQQRIPAMRVITQNVDNLHEQAGSTDVIRLHGNLAVNRCFFNCQGDPTVVDISMLEWKREEGPPSCPHCGRWVRPDVVWFGEMLPSMQLEAARDVCAQADVMLVIGTTGLVTPAGDMPRWAKDVGAKVIEVNPDYSMVTRMADVWLQAPSGEVLPKVVERVSSAEY